jgi:hypothetical protein
MVLTVFSFQVDVTESRGSNDDAVSRFTSFDTDTARWRPTVAFQAGGDGGVYRQ